MNNAAKQKTTSSYSSPTQRFFLLKLKDVGEERFEGDVTETFATVAVVTALLVSVTARFALQGIEPDHEEYEDDEANRWKRAHASLMMLSCFFNIVALVMAVVLADLFNKTCSTMEDMKWWINNFGKRMDIPIVFTILGMACFIGGLVVGAVVKYGPNAAEWVGAGIGCIVVIAAFWFPILYECNVHAKKKEAEQDSASDERHSTADTTQSTHTAGGQGGVRFGFDTDMST